MPSNINLKFIGTGTIAADPNRSCTCSFLEFPKEKILIDIGSGTLQRLSQEQINVHSINYIFITHFHPDHIADLISFLFALRFARSTYKKEKLQIWGPRGLIKFIKGMEISYGRWIRDTEMNIEFSEFGRHLLDFPGFRVIWNKVLHKSESVAFRFEVGDKVISFSGDSGYCRELIQICKNADVAVLECSHSDEHAVEGHLSPSLAAKIADEADAKTMALTHFYPDAIKSDIKSVAQKYFKGKIVLASDGMQLLLSITENPSSDKN